MKQRWGAGVGETVRGIVHMRLFFLFFNTSRHVKMMIVERRRLHDEKHPELDSSFLGVALKYEFDPFHLEYTYGAQVN
jgi:hypothetical protein